MTAALRNPVLDGLGVDHGFGVRGLGRPAGLRLPRQVHGTKVTTVEACTRTPSPEADAIVSTAPEVWIGIVTADCVPILLASETGRVVAAVHAGWRGLASGVIGAGIAAVRGNTEESGRIVAAIGPHIGPCCYEVDEPVTAAFEERFETTLARAVRPSRPGHVKLDLGALVRQALMDAGVARDDIGGVNKACTSCDAVRFHSYRRDGSAAGRLVHFIRASR